MHADVCAERGWVMAWVEHEYAEFEALVRIVAAELKEACLAGIAARGSALLALAGGRTPLPIYRRLAERAVPWPKVVVMPTDERCVPHDHPACNLRELAGAFDAAHGVTFESLTPDDGDPETSEAWAADVLARHPQRFDAVLLGMGADGHTASLFPGAPALTTALAPDSGADACRIDPRPLPPEAPFLRITLTLPRLLRARSLHLVITGQEKREVLRRAHASHDPQQHPVAAVLHAPDALVHVHWSP